MRSVVYAVEPTQTYWGLLVSCSCSDGGDLGWSLAATVHYHCNWQLALTRGLSDFESLQKCSSHAMYRLGSVSPKGPWITSVSQGTSSSCGIILEKIQSTEFRFGGQERHKCVCDASSRVFPPATAPPQPSVMRRHPSSRHNDKCNSEVSSTTRARAISGWPCQNGTVVGLGFCEARRLPPPEGASVSLHFMHQCASMRIGLCHTGGETTTSQPLTTTCPLPRWHRNTGRTPHPHYSTMVLGTLHIPPPPPPRQTAA